MPRGYAGRRYRRGCSAGELKPLPDSGFSGDSISCTRPERRHVVNNHHACPPWLAVRVAEQLRPTAVSRQALLAKAHQRRPVSGSPDIVARIRKCIKAFSTPPQAEVWLPALPDTNQKKFPRHRQLKQRRQLFRAGVKLASRTSPQLRKLWHNPGPRQQGPLRRIGIWLPAETGGEYLLGERRPQAANRSPGFSPSRRPA